VVSETIDTRLWFACHAISAGVVVKWLIQIAEGTGAIVALFVAAILWFAQSSIESLIEAQRAARNRGH
jgi:hypothetical protein